MNGQEEKESIISPIYTQPEYLTIDFNSHTKECLDNKTCPNGWLILWCEEIEMLEPFAKAPQCHTYGFLTNKRMFGDTTGNYWNFKYPEYLHIHYEPPEITLRNELKGIISV